MDITGLKRNSAAAEAGTWIDDIPSMENLRLRVRGLTSKIAIETRARKERAVSKKGRFADGRLKPTESRRVLGETLFEVVLIEWDGLTEGGKPLKYNPELAKKWLLDSDYEPFADAVVYAAQVADRLTADTAEDVSGNSSSASSGKSSGAR